LIHFGQKATLKPVNRVFPDGYIYFLVVKMETFTSGSESRGGTQRNNMNSSQHHHPHDHNGHNDNQNVLETDTDSYLTYVSLLKKSKRNLSELGFGPVRYPWNRSGKVGG
jgi:hypothetical protein